MNLRRILASRGVHYFATRFGWSGLRRAAFDEKYRRGEWNGQSDGDGELAATVKKYLKRGDLLILGCGGSSVLAELDPAEFQTALGIDLSEEAIRLASRFRSDKIDFQVADMTVFKCPRAYDVILFSESIYYVPSNSLETLLKRLSKSLKPGGRFVVTLAQPKRYASILTLIRQRFELVEDRLFLGSSRHLTVFGDPCGPNSQTVKR